MTFFLAILWLLKVLWFFHYALQSTIIHFLKAVTIWCFQFMQIKPVRFLEAIIFIFDREVQTTCAKIWIMMIHAIWVIR